MACFLPCFMDDGYECLSELIGTGGWETFDELRRGKARKPGLLPVTRVFEDEAEARKVYGLFKDTLNRIPRKGLDLNPCIFLWYRVTMTPSDIALRMCVIAWMLQDEEYLDEAARLIPLLGQGSLYGSIRALAARVLLYRPTTAVRKRRCLNCSTTRRKPRRNLRISWQMIWSLQWRIILKSRKI